MDFISIYTQLSEAMLTPGKPFEALRAGTFTDMLGRTATVTEDFLQRLVENTRRAIEATKSDSGEILGLPIDTQKHDHGDAAGWIVGIELNDGVLKLTPRWTELGVEKIKKGIQKLFSASLNMADAVLLGGSLTNWPAVKGLKPVELSEGGLVQFMLDDESYGDAQRRVRQQFFMYHEKWHPGMGCCWPGDVYEGYLAVDVKGQLMKVAYTDSETGEVEFAPEADWTKLRMVPVEMAVTLFEKKLNEFRGWIESKLPAAPKPEEIEMTKEEMEALLKSYGLVPGGAATNPAAGTTEAAAPVNPEVATLANLPELRTQLASQIDAAMKAELENVRASAGRTFAAMLAELGENQRVSEFSRTISDGSLAGLAMPIAPDRLEKFLLSLNTNQRAEAEAILGETVRSGLVDFNVVGRPGAKTVLKALPEHLAKQLTEGKLTVADLSSEIIAPLLEDKLENYDLSRWNGQSK